MENDDQEQILSSAMSESKMSSKKGASARSRFEDKSNPEKPTDEDEDEEEDGSDMSDSECVIRGEDMIVSTLNSFDSFFSITQRVVSEIGLSLAEKSTASILRTRNSANLETTSDLSTMMGQDPSELMS